MSYPPAPAPHLPMYPHLRRPNSWDRRSVSNKREFSELKDTVRCSADRKYLTFQLQMLFKLRITLSSTIIKSSNSNSLPYPGLSAAKMRKSTVCGGMAGEMSSPPVSSGSLPMETVPEQPVARRRVSMGGGSHNGVVGSRGKRPLGHSRPLSLPDFDGLFPGSGPSSPR